MSTSPRASPLPLPARLVILDLDGTMVDSAPDLWVSAEQMLRSLGRAGISQERLRSYVGNGIEWLVHRCLSGELDTRAPAAEFAVALERFMQLYAIHNGRHSRLYAGVLQGLTQLRGAGVMRACVTNKPREFTLTLMNAMGLCPFMDLVVGGDEVLHKKPAPDGLLRACRELGVSVSQSVMIGDSSNDVLAARAAGMAVLCVDYGYNHGRDIHEQRPDAVASRLEELISLVT